VLSLALSVSLARWPPSAALDAGQHDAHAGNPSIPRFRAYTGSVARSDALSGADAARHRGLGPPRVRVRAAVVSSSRLSAQHARS